MDESEAESNLDLGILVNGQLHHLGASERLQPVIVEAALLLVGESYAVFLPDWAYRSLVFGGGLISRRCSSPCDRSPSRPWAGRSFSWRPAEIRVVDGDTADASGHPPADVLGSVVDGELHNVRWNYVVPDPLAVRQVLAEYFGIVLDEIRVLRGLGDPVVAQIVAIEDVLFAFGHGFDATDATVWSLVTCPVCHHLVAQGLPSCSRFGLALNAATGEVCHHRQESSEDTALLESLTRPFHPLAPENEDNLALRRGRNWCPGVDSHVEVRSLPAA